MNSVCPVWTIAASGSHQGPGSGAALPDSVVLNAASVCGPAGLPRAGTDFQGQ